MEMYLTKSDFVAAQTCPTKLHYRKHLYPRNDEDNEFLKMLAEGGYIVGKMAQLLHPDGIEITGTVEEAIATTETLLSAHENITLFEAAIAVNHQLVRVDILIKNGDDFRIIEVKSKSFNSDDMRKAHSKGKPYWLKTEYRPYLEDVGFQKTVLQQRYPNATIHSALMLPDTAKETQLDGVVGWFDVQTSRTTSGRRIVAVSFTGSEEQLEALRNDHVLEVIAVDQYIDPMLEKIREQAETYVESILADERIATQITCHCNKCEYKLSDDDSASSGFQECWGDLAAPNPHILDLAQLGNFNKAGTGKIGWIDALILESKTSLLDVLESYLYTGGAPAYNGRPFYQRTMNEEFLLEGFATAISKVEYPLHFIDFETYTSSIPPHAGMHPYDKVMFQWSCHTIETAGAEPVHKGWLSTDGNYPNVNFATSLRAHIGDTGTVLTWSPYENTQLKTLLYMFKQLEDRGMVGWLETIVNLKNGRISRQLDMHDLANKFYFHPRMGGRTSIKVTLPAALLSTTSERVKRWLKAEGLYAVDDQHLIIDPYQLLPEPDVAINGKTLKVAEGGGAMRAYQDMVYGAGREDAAVKKEYSSALERYCRLDTLAMVIVWEHWKSLVPGC